MLVGACEDIAFTNLVFRFMPKKGVSIKAKENAAYLRWSSSHEWVAGYRWKSGNYPDRIKFDHCRFTHIGQDTDSNAILLSYLTTRVTITGCLFRWCVDGVDLGAAGSGHLIEGNTFEYGLLNRGDYQAGDGLDIQNVRPRTQTSWVDAGGTSALPDLNTIPATWDGTTWTDAAGGKWKVRPTVVTGNTFRLLPGRGMETEHGNTNLEIYGNTFENCQIGIRVHYNALVECELAYFQSQWNRSYPGKTCPVPMWDSTTPAGVDDWAWIDQLEPGGVDGTYLYATRDINIYRNLFYTTSTDGVSGLDVYTSSTTSFGETELDKAGVVFPQTKLHPGQEAAIHLKNTNENPGGTLGGTADNVNAFYGFFQWDQMVFKNIRVINNTIYGMAPGGRVYSSDYQHAEHVGFGIKVTSAVAEGDETICSSAT